MERNSGAPKTKEQRSHATVAYRTPFDMNIPLESYLRHQGAEIREPLRREQLPHVSRATDVRPQTEYGSLENAFKNVKAEVLNVNLHGLAVPAARIAQNHERPSQHGQDGH